MCAPARSDLRRTAVSRTRRWFAVAAMILFSSAPGCILWEAPPPTAEKLDVGLIVLYPGAYNSQWEMQGFHQGFRAAGRNEAIEVVQWARHLEQWLAPEGFSEAISAWAETEARRIATYKAAHPGARVTLLGYSSGAMIAILVAERMPENTPVDRVILMSAGVSRDYDLGPMLDNTIDGAVVYWSPLDEFAVGLVERLGTMDGDFQSPAARFGFATVHEKLTQIAWEPAMIEYGNHGGHLDYLVLPDWIRDFVARWIAGTADKPADPDPVPVAGKVAVSRRSSCRAHLD